jgi:hypothetical protein
VAILSAAAALTQNARVACRQGAWVRSGHPGRVSMPKTLSEGPSWSVGLKR